MIDQSDNETFGTPVRAAYERPVVIELQLPTETKGKTYPTAGEYSANSGPS